MPYVYDAVHGNIKHVEDDDTFDERGVLKAGKHVRVPMMMMDSMQRAIAGSVTTVDGDSDRSREAYDYAKAELGARYKGGLEPGDTFRLGDRMVVVQNRNPENGKLQLRDAAASASDAGDARMNMYNEYDNDIQSRYLNNTNDAKAGEVCQTAGREKGTWQNKGGRLVCVAGKDKSSKENELAGPLSDAARIKVMDEAYASYDDQIQNAWRK